MSAQKTNPAQFRGCGEEGSAGCGRDDPAGVGYREFCKAGEGMFYRAAYRYPGVRLGNNVLIVFTVGWDIFDDKCKKNYLGCKDWHVFHTSFLLR
jgi:hypothetical protein